MASTHSSAAVLNRGSAMRSSCWNGRRCTISASNPPTQTALAAR